MFRAEMEVMLGWFLVKLTYNPMPISGVIIKVHKIPSVAGAYQT